MPEPATTPDRVERIAYSPDEAAEALGLGRNLIFKMLRDGRLRRFKIGSATRIPAADVHALIDDQQH